jgi:hypothetical protein
MVPILQVSSFVDQSQWMDDHLAAEERGGELERA